METRGEPSDNQWYFAKGQYSQFSEFVGLLPPFLF
jgi:hypothetical protein